MKQTDVFFERETLRRQLAATEEALRQVQRENAELREDLALVKRLYDHLRASIGPQTCDVHASFSLGCLNCRLAQRDAENERMRRVCEAAVAVHIAWNAVIRVCDLYATAEIPIPSAEDDETEEALVVLNRAENEARLAMSCAVAEYRKQQEAE